MATETAAATTSAAAASGGDPEFIKRGPGYVDNYPPKHVWNVRPLLDYDHETIWTRFILNSLSIADSPFLGSRAYDPATRKFGGYEWVSYGDAAKIVADLGSGLAHIGAKPDDRLAIFSDNRCEWVLAEYAMLRQGCTTVPLYSTFGVPAIAHIVGEAELRVAVCSREVFPILLEAAEVQREPNARFVDTVVLMPRLPNAKEESESAVGALFDRAAASRIRVITWEELLQIGRDHPCEQTPGGPEAVHSIIYTSGTCGVPKGAVITHRAWTVTADKVSGHPSFGENENMCKQVHLSYLPLAHVYERAFMCVVVRYGACAGFYSGSTSRLVEDIQALSPTFILGVPRVWKRIAEKVQEKVNSGGMFMRWMFNHALAAKTTAELTGVPTWIDYDKLVFSKTRKLLGTRCTFVGSAAAPLPPDLNDWLRRVLCVDVVQMYGSTEISGGLIAQVPSVINPGSAGFACLHGVVRLINVPELGYRCTDPLPRGEILASGRSIMREYYKNPQATAEALDADGWLHTGDIGQLNADWTISIIDRKKNLFKLAQGEYVPCELIETLFSQCPVVSQAWIHGESTDTFVVAIVVPSLEALASADKLQPQTRALAAAAVKAPAGEEARRLCDMQEVRDYVLSELTATAEKAHLPGFQRPRGVWLEPVAWEVESDTITPTFKLKRPVLRKKYAEQLRVLLEQVRAMPQPSTAAK